MKSAAVVTIRRPDTMTKRGRRSVANWLRKQANFLEEYGNEMDRKFTARYLYSGKR